MWAAARGATRYGYLIARTAHIADRTDQMAQPERTGWRGGICVECLASGESRDIGRAQTWGRLRRSTGAKVAPNCALMWS